MDAADLLGTLVETTLAASAAVLLALILRRPLRRAFGSTIAYALWLLVPAAMIAVLLPAAQLPSVAELGAGHAGTFQAFAPAQADAIGGYAWWLLAFWISGAVMMACRLASQQRAFCRRMGKLRWLGGNISQAEGSAGLPAVIGVVRPRIVLPGDFHSRYSHAEQRLMQAHETMHLRSGDPHLNALNAVLRCVFWFNPLMHMASRHFRHDQELACDQRVIARHPDARRVYGEAMLKTQLAAQPLPLGCHWGYSHPLKERIAMLKQPVPSSSRWCVGSAVLVALLVSSGVAAWAAQPPVELAGAVVSAGAPPPPPPVPPAPPEAPPAPAAPVFSAHPAAPSPPPPRPARPPAPPAPAAAPAPTVDASSMRTEPPRYPGEALASRISGEVVLLIDIDATGTPTNVVVEQSEPAGVFDQASVDAALKWRFAPAVEDGQPVAGRLRVPVEFKAPKTAQAPASPGSNS